jgi:cytochrome c biogenesis protein CcmG/thiol:disulfide interchange protein DsbE
MKRSFYIPLAIFVALVVFLAIGLTRDPREVPSPLIDKPAPAFALSRLDTPEQVFTPKQLAGKVWLLNVWASWCVACREEHELLVAFSKAGLVPIYGLDYKDTRDDALGWLKQFGNPYTAAAFDQDGKVGIDYGVYGVPETFVIDKTGTIRYKQIGPITPDVLEHTILPLVRKLNA